MKHYFTTRGRTGRVEYITLLLIISLLDGTVVHSLNSIVLSSIFTICLGVVVILGISWILFTAVVRRLHDLGVSGWWLLFLFGFACILFHLRFLWPLTIIMGLGKVCLMACPGNRETNKFGPVPAMFEGFFEESGGVKRKGQRTPNENGRLDFKL